MTKIIIGTTQTLRFLSGFRNRVSRGDRMEILAIIGITYLMGYVSGYFWRKLMYK